MQQLIDTLYRLADPEKASVLQRFFKTGKGEYGEGDIFIGITVPKIRNVAKSNISIPTESVSELLASEIHEMRLCGLLILAEQYRLARKQPEACRNIVDFYLKHTNRINNWDLVDLSAPNILGTWVADTGETDILHRLSLSADMWEQRISVVATLTLIRANDYSTTLTICRHLLQHPHQLIHKATGWMLREVGKRDLNTLTKFLDSHATDMPRTALRYAIERFPEPLRQHYLHIKKK